MKRKLLVLLTTVPTILLGLVFFIYALTSVDLVQFPKSYIARAQTFSLEDLNLVTEISPTQDVLEMLEQVDRDRALSDLRRLTGEEPVCISTDCYTITNRLTGGEGLEWAMNYLYDQLIALDYSVEFQEWSRSDYADRNLIARKTGVLTSTEEVYLVAHVDGVKYAQERYPAADDNAGSVVNGLELARVFSNRSFGRTIVLFFSTGEEQGARGVREYLDHLSPTELAAIKYVINRDVTGYDANGDEVMELVHGGHAPSLALSQVMSATIDAYQLNLDQRLIVGCP